MKIANLVSLFAALMLAMALGSTTIAIWTTDRSEFFKQRISLAHRSYEGHLQLIANTYQLFKQYGDAMLIGDRDRGAGEAQLIAQIRTDIAGIRRVIGEEIELVGSEEIEELQALSRIERKIEDLIVQFEAFRLDASPDSIRNRWAVLSNILDNEIDRDFITLVDEVLREEYREVEETRAMAAAAARQAIRLAYGFAAVALLITTLAIVMYRRQIALPLSQLIDGVRRFSAGDFKSRINPHGSNEISEIGAVLDDMAASVDTRTNMLTAHNTRLESAVKQRTSELEHLLAEAEATAVNRRQLLADVSHELRTPLTIIQGESEVALRGEPKSIPEYQEALRRARDTAKHTNRLVDDLLFISRKEAGEIHLDVQETDLNALLEQTLALFGNDVPILPSVEKATAKIDALRIRQCVLALLHNARRHGGTDIVARIDHAPIGFRIAIEDNGPGLSDTDKAHAFERFFRGSNAARNYSDGTGLGLPVVRAIMEAHGGTAQLADRAGGGLIAVINIPARPTLRTAS